MVSGTAGAHAITMGFSPVITRIYGPEAFGVLGVFMAVLAVLTPVAALTYPIAIVMPEEDRDAKAIAKASIVIAMVMSFVMASILVFNLEWIAEKLNFENMAGLLFFMPVAMLSATLYQVLSQWLIRKRQFRLSAQVLVLQALIVNVAKTGGGWMYPASITLIFIATASQALHALLLRLGSRKVFLVEASCKADIRVTVELLKKYREFPAYRAPQVLLNAAGQSLPVIIVAALFGTASAGHLALTKSVLAAPILLIGSSVGNVFYPRAVELYSRGAELSVFLIKTTYGLFALGLIIFLPVIFWGPLLFTYVFGDQWEPAGEYARWVSLWMVFSLAARPAISVLPVIKLQKQFLILEVAFLPIKVGSLYIGLLTKNSLLSIVAYSLVNVAFYIVVSIYTYVKTGRT